MRQLVHLGGADPGVDRTGHEGEALRLGRVVVGRHERGGRQGGRARLADGQHVGPGADVLEVADHLGDVVVEVETPVLEPDVTGVVPVRHVHVVIGQERTHGGPEQGREVPGQGRHQQHRRLGDGDVLGEVQERRERGGDGDLLAHRQLFATHRHRRNAPGRAVVGEPRTLDHLVAGGHLPHQAIVGPAPGQPTERPRGQARQRPCRGRQVPLPLVCLVEHHLQPTSTTARGPSHGPVSLELEAARRRRRGGAEAASRRRGGGVDAEIPGRPPSSAGKRMTRRFAAAGPSGGSETTPEKGEGIAGGVAIPSRDSPGLGGGVPLPVV